MCRDKNAIQCGGFDFGSTEAEAAYWERVNEADRIEALYALKQNRHLWPVTTRCREYAAEALRLAKLKRAEAGV